MVLPPSIYDMAVRVVLKQCFAVFSSDWTFNAVLWFHYNVKPVKRSIYPLILPGNPEMTAGDAAIPLLFFRT
jgi:hypothetical protein